MADDPATSVPRDSTGTEAARAALAPTGDEPRRTVLPAAGAAAPAKSVLTPMTIASVIARNLVSVIGVLFFGWSAPVVLLLCFADTLAAMAVLFFVLIWYFAQEAARESLADRINAWGGGLFAVLFLTGFVSIPLGGPLYIFIFGVQGVSWREIVGNTGFQWGLAAQAFASLTALGALLREARRVPLEQLRLKRRFGILFLRWFCVVALCMTPIVYFFGRWGALLLVIAYAGITVYMELLPNRFLAHFNADDDDEGSGGRSRPDRRLSSDPAVIARTAARHKRRQGRR